MPRTAPPTRDMFKAFQALQTRWADNDEYGHLNNAVYPSLFDTAISQWQLENGINIRGADAARFLVVEIGVTYFAELAFPDSLTAGLRLAHLGRSSYRMEVGLFRGDDTVAATLGFFANVLTDGDGRPTPIPDDLRAKLGTILIDA